MYLDVVRDKETHVLDVVGDKVTHVSCVVSHCLCAVFLTRPADSSASCTACAQQLLTLGDYLFSKDVYNSTKLTGYHDFNTR